MTDHSNDPAPHVPSRERLLASRGGLVAVTVTALFGLVAVYLVSTLLASMFIDLRATSGDSAVGRDAVVKSAETQIRALITGVALSLTIVLFTGASAGVAAVTKVRLMRTVWTVGGGLVAAAVIFVVTGMIAS